MQTNNINEAIAARDAGMQTAEDHANTVHEGWGQQAFQFLLGYIATNTAGAFMGEDVRTAAYAAGVPIPPTHRAWGNVMMRAAKAGLITKQDIGPVSNPKAHKANANIWITSKQQAA